MKKNLITIAAVATIATGAAMSPTAAQARWHRGFPVAPVVGGLAAGALLGAALAAPHYYYGDEPIYFGPRCVFRHERFWDGWAGTFAASRIAIDARRPFASPAGPMSST